GFRTGRRAALCLRGGDRTRPHRCASRRADGARYSALCAATRSAEAPGHLAGECRLAGCGRNGHLMTTAYITARRGAGWIEKLLQVHWPLVLLIGVIASIGFAMQYSMAGGHLYPWAAPQMMRFAVGLVLLFAVALV